jgi:hypothetical protein
VTTRSLWCSKRRFIETRCPMTSMKMETTPPKRRYTFSKIRGITSQNTLISTTTSMMTSNVKTILHADGSQSENFIKIISFDVSRTLRPDEPWSCELWRSTLPKTYTLKQNDDDDDDNNNNNNNKGEGGGVVVKALSYKPAGRGFDSRWCHWNFSVTQSCRSHYVPGVGSASKINEYQVYFLRVKAAGA